MIEYVHEKNIDNRIIKKADPILLNGGLIAAPTDTNFSIFCLPNQKDGISKLKRLKGNNDYFTFTLFCSSISQIAEYVELSNTNFKIIKQHTPGPFVFILPTLPKISKKLNMKRNEIGIRITSSLITQSLLEHIETPLYGITAAKDMANSHWWDDVFADNHLFEFGWELESINEIDLIIDNITGEPHSKVLSTVVDLTKESPVVLRQGILDFNS